MIWEVTKWVVENALNILILFGIAATLFYAIAYILVRLTWWTDSDNKFIEKVGAIMLAALNLLPFLLPKKRK
jgi:CHASE2 domain-containing sensor protein